MLSINKTVTKFSKAIISFDTVVELSTDLSASLAHHHPH